MLKKGIGKHHSASNNTTNSKEKNVTYSHYFHITEFYPTGPVRYAKATLDLSRA